MPVTLKDAEMIVDLHMLIKIIDRKLKILRQNCSVSVVAIGSDLGDKVEVTGKKDSNAILGGVLSAMTREYELRRADLIRQLHQLDGGQPDGPQ